MKITVNINLEIEVTELESGMFEAHSESYGLICQGDTKELAVKDLVESILSDEDVMGEGIEEGFVEVVGFDV